MKRVCTDRQKDFTHFIRWVHTRRLLLLTSLVLIAEPGVSFLPIAQGVRLTSPFLRRVFFNIIKFKKAELLF